MGKALGDSLRFWWVFTTSTDGSIVTGLTPSVSVYRNTTTTAIKTGTATELGATGLYYFDLGGVYTTTAGEYIGVATTTNTTVVSKALAMLYDVARYTSYGLRFWWLYTAATDGAIVTGLTPAIAVYQNTTAAAISTGTATELGATGLYYFDVAAGLVTAKGEYVATATTTNATVRSKALVSLYDVEVIASTATGKYDTGRFNIQGTILSWLYGRLVINKPASISTVRLNVDHPEQPLNPPEFSAYFIGDIQAESYLGGNLGSETHGDRRSAIMILDCWVSRKVTTWRKQLAQMEDSVRKSFNELMSSGSALKVKDFYTDESAPADLTYLIWFDRVEVRETDHDPNPDIERRHLLVYFQYTERV